MTPGRRVSRGIRGIAGAAVLILLGNYSVGNVSASLGVRF